MSNLALMVIENIALMALVGFLCWYFESGWAVLLLFAMNQWKSTDVLKDKNETTQTR